MDHRIFRQFNKYGEGAVKSLIQKALTADATSGGALSPQSLEQLITQTLIKLSPMAALVTPKKIESIQHDFNRLIALPTRGGAQGDGGATRRSQGTYKRDQVKLKVIRRIGEVSGFVKDGTNQDVVAIELENHLYAHILDISYYNTWGNLGNGYEYGGLDYFVATNRSINASGGVSATLPMLDKMIAANTRAGGARHRKCFLMSPEMLAFIGGLVNYYRLTQGIEVLNQIEINAGWKLAAYRGIPIIETTYTRPTTKMGTVTSTPYVDAGGSLANGTYYYWVAAVTLQGEQAVNAQATTVMAGSNTATALAWAVVPEAMAYRIYYTSTINSAATAKLIKVVPAFTYNADGSISGDTLGTNILTNSPDWNVSTLAGSTPPGMQNDIPYKIDPTVLGNVPEETIVLWDLDEIQGLGKMPFTNGDGDRMEGLVTVEPLAKTDDFVPFLIKSYTALTPSFEATSIIQRGILAA